MTDKFVPRKKVLEKLGIHYQTLYNMVERNDIEYIKVGTKHLYNLDKYLRDNGVINEEKKKKICYCRVSSNKQKEDLKRQIEYMEEKYPNHKIISDIASSLNFKRKGLMEIINMAISGEVEELVIAYKDRLARIGYELIENIIIIYSKGKIIIIKTGEGEAVRVRE